MKLPIFKVSHFDYEGYYHLDVKACNLGAETIVPPAGKDYAFEVQKWARQVEISISPTGRSVRVWVDGVEVPKVGEMEVTP